MRGKKGVEVKCERDIDKTLKKEKKEENFQYVSELFLSFEFVCVIFIFYNFIYLIF